MRAFSDTKVGPLHLAMPVIRRILHSSDFSEASLIAFAHALKAALIGKSKLTLIHVSDDEIDGTEFPGVRETLERWKLLPPGSPNPPWRNLDSMWRRSSDSGRIRSKECCNISRRMAPISLSSLLTTTERIGCATRSRSLWHESPER